MSSLARTAFAKPGRMPAGTVVALVGEDLRLGPMARKLGLDGIIARVAAIAEFKGKAMSSCELFAPAGTDLERLVLVGTGKPSELKEHDWLRLGGAALGALGKAKAATVLLDRPDGRRLGPGAASDFALGMKLRSYSFDTYKSRKPDDADDKRDPVDVTLWVEHPGDARRAFNARDAAAAGVALARDLIHDPANVLGPVEFAERAAALASDGLEIEVLTEVEMKALGMAAFLGVSQGSPRPPRLVIMRWNGGRAKDRPIAFVGKGVVFDTGGISIKPAGGMEDMKGDMAGAAAVTGLMRTLARRKARANVIGVIGLVENMPDGNAQRPGDIVKAMTGKTIEIINTDAEGRLVLADAIAYTEDRFQPEFIVDLATLTGAVIVALGHHYAAMYSTDDALAAALFAAGEVTGDRVWRMPLGPEYDKLIDSKIADVKNTGGRAAGSITGAQFIKRFVKKTPWVHLDIAGAAMDSPSTEINRSWSSGWGVRILDRLVSDKYERR